MKLSPTTLLFGVSVAVVTAAVAAGLLVLGSPAEERARRLDDRRVTDLHGIAAATDLYWTRHSRLPESLQELAAEPGVRISTGDPVSSEAYGYRTLDSTVYEVCADFERASVEVSIGSASAPPIFQQSCPVCHQPDSVGPTEADGPVPVHRPARELWTHEAGHQCFQLEAEVVPRSRSDSA